MWVKKRGRDGGGRGEVKGGMLGRERRKRGAEGRKPLWRRECTAGGRNGGKNVERRWR